MRIKFKIGPLLIAFFLVISVTFFVISLLIYIGYNPPPDEKQGMSVQAEEPLPATSKEVKGSLKVQPNPIPRSERAQEGGRQARSSERVEVVGDEELARAIEEALKEKLDEQGTIPSPRDEGKEYDYSEYDKLFYGIERTIGGRKIIWNLDMIGIPIDITDQSKVRVFQPTPEEKRRMDELHKEVHEIFQKYEVDNIEDFRKLPNVDEEDKIRLEEIAAEYEAINEQALRPSPSARATRMTTEVSHRLDDGTVITWYRRKDGALIRQVRKPDGTVLKFVAGWIDWSQYPEWMREEIIENARPE